ncbi:DUF2892 domain-containing protein [Flavitalea sp. BT771]|uniref:YgaP family membrane protein n=1 Tax=Flavitalea sp. BT771 TaxID=3063329 RepID=UPI0026E15E06|nr:DUF2892 domain-containing protein [Flavitalea sp. BT771]MDO6429511.1 DUF2892 domain-containing protein [Flavitalea sp. BT771]MDV6218361.1 DUF2892 domain-containing protein [Flavitalea sp. BT771]
MKKNMGDVDRALRIVAAGLAVILYSLGIITGTIGAVLLVLAGIFLITSFVGFCPLYKVFGINTCKLKKA